MKVQMLITKECIPCLKASALWQEICDEKGLDFEVLENPGDGRDLAEHFNLKSFPALIINGRLVAAGVQTREQALELLANVDTDAP